MESLIDAKKWPKGLPRITETNVAYYVASLLLKNQYFHRSEKIESKKGYLKVNLCFLYFYFALMLCV